MSDVIENTLLTPTPQFLSWQVGAVSFKQGERFDQGKAQMEQRFQERWYPTVMGNYSLFLRREAETLQE
jgi:hypothetical protein